MLIKPKKEGVIDISKKSFESFKVPVGFVGQDGIMELSKYLTIQ